MENNNGNHLSANGIAVPPPVRVRQIVIHDNEEIVSAEDVNLKQRELKASMRALTTNLWLSIVPLFFIGLMLLLEESTAKTLTLLVCMSVSRAFVPLISAACNFSQLKQVVQDYIDKLNDRLEWLRK